MSDQSVELQAQVANAAGSGDRLRLQGSNSYSGYSGSSAPNAGTTLNTSGHTGIVSYEPTEMVVTVRSGTPLTDLDAVLRGEGQRLGVECPRLSPDATVGGAIAMGFSGSARPFTGALRDFVLGIRLVNGLGEDLKFGGQVMKNVAGYDLPRLLVGSRGVLGLLLEISLKLLPAPEEQLYLAYAQPHLPAATAFTHKLIAAAEPLTGASYYRGVLHLRFAGRAATLARLRRELGGEVDGSRWWDNLEQWRLPWGSPAWRNYRHRLSDEPQTPGDWLADWNGGLIWSAEPEPTAAAALELGRTAAPAGLRGQIEQRLRRAFDPQTVFSGGSAG